MKERLKMAIDFRNQQMFLPNSLTETNNQLQVSVICNVRELQKLYQEKNESSIFCK